MKGRKIESIEYFDLTELAGCEPTPKFTEGNLLIIEPSLKALSKLKCLNLSHNKIVEMEHLKFSHLK